MIEIYDRVRIVNSTDPRLDGQEATVMGMYGESFIVLFDSRPEGYAPAAVFVPAIIEKV
jgi:hypothetical protein